MVYVLPDLLNMVELLAEFINCMHCYIIHNNKK